MARPEETPGATDWRAVETTPEFRELTRAKRGFVLPATVFFILYYFALPVLVGYYPELMSRDVVGEINVAYLFALSQFAIAWVIMALYVKRARGFDSLAARVAAKVKGAAR